MKHTSSLLDTLITMLVTVIALTRAAPAMATQSESNIVLVQQDASVDHVSGGAIAGAVLGCLGALVLACLLAWCWRRNRHSHEQFNDLDQDQSDNYEKREAEVDRPSFKHTASSYLHGNTLPFDYTSTRASTRAVYHLSTATTDNITTTNSRDEEYGQDFNNERLNTSYNVHSKNGYLTAENVHPNSGLNAASTSVQNNIASNAIV
ncbi:hypothetical protein BGZ99_005762 [Dissophora globulifera]|uniref:Uncharacterized protein n=1 Tax=Dissophora globulifera TaxID=979702 RepID=A0A9P6UZM5_9FUNG|nr:hypothetical protein BGZ99_005762 [Dissophora globulifera]